MMSRWHEETLPDVLPDGPMEIAVQWFQHAVDGRVQPNPDAMVLASADRTGKPSARVVLCKRFIVDPGYIVFFTNYDSRKGRELAERPDVAAVFHWDSLRRQIRIEGSVTRSPDHESDEYFAARAWQSRIGAWASRQSEPVSSREALLRSVSQTASRFGAAFADGRFVGPGDAARIPRPTFWGGYRLWIDRLELWTEGAGRVHDRALWRRDLHRIDGDRCETGPWECCRLQP
jgi:pyridoxamine 5'-phosphate oxidase